MNSTQDCILGVLSGTKYVLKYEGIEAYLVSIKKSGFKGRKVMIVWNIHPIARKLLQEYGFELIDVKSKSHNESFFHARIRVAQEYLGNHYKEFRYIFWLDIKDVVLQSDPSIWMEENIGNYKLVGSTECVTIEQEETNQLWARDVLGKDRYEEIKNEEVINGGTFAGEAKLIAELFHQTYLITKEYSGPHPPCQPAINYVFRQHPFSDHLYIPRWSKSFATCLHPVWSWSAREKLRFYLRDKPPVLNMETGILYPGTISDPKNDMIAFNRYSLEIISAEAGPMIGCECVKSTNTKPFAIVHGYDRDWQIRELMESKYTMEYKVNNKVSIFTPTHNSEFLPEIYKSLQAQTDPDWEWIIIYNHDGKPLTFNDDRVKGYVVYNVPEWVGPLKAMACEKATGDILLELDHDDLLMPTAIEEVKKAFEDPEVGFAYSNTIHCTGDYQKIDRFSTYYGWKYREVEFQGHILDEHISFEPTPESISRIWFAPNHLRAFRRSAYDSVGGYNMEMRILDDLDLMCKLYRVTKFKHIDKGLYIYRVHGNNTWIKYNAEIQNNVYRIYDQYIESLAETWAENSGLKKIEVGGRMAAKFGYETVDLKDADIMCDLNGRWPYADSSVGVIRSFDVFEHLLDPIHTMKELQRVLAPGGWAFIQVPSTDGRGAFQDPTHKSFWNINSFKYYTEANMAKYIDNPVRFQAPRLYDTDRNPDGVIWTRAHLICCKDGYRPCGALDI